MNRRREDYSDLIGWLLRPARRVYVGVLFVLLCGLVGICLVLFARVRHDERQLRTALSNQTGNRTQNVAAWCNAINQLDGALTGYVRAAAKAHPGIGIASLNLTPLSCADLETQTLASTK